MIRPSPPGVHGLEIAESPRHEGPELWTHPEWERRYPWLVQGTTGRGEGEAPERWSFGLFTDPPAPRGVAPWEELAGVLGFPRIVHSRQLHGRELLAHGEDLTADSSRDRRLHLATDADGHLTDVPGILLGVTVADCVPVFLVDPVQRAVALLHAGWRGVAEGILEGALATLGEEYGSLPEEVHMHLGPAICGRCYEVGPEVHRALGMPEPSGPRPVDLRDQLAIRGVRRGLREAHVTVSTWCSRCPGSPFFSHRRGEGGRQVAFLGVRPGAERGREARSAEKGGGS